MKLHKRTRTCGELHSEHAGQTVTLNGWVHRNRNHGGVHFINLRDRYGLTQVVISEDSPTQVKNIAETLKFEFCIAVVGEVRLRPDSMKNPSLPTGEIEVAAEDIVILSTSEVLPFMIGERSEASDDLRLKYRYLDLRSASMQQNIRLRAQVCQKIREYLTSQNFLEIETPIMIRSTPEGARDFLIPSRMNPGKFYAMPQSPQLFKQLLMISGFDRYFQIAHCFRDEDLRGDRQPEHSQIDIEMSFASQEDIFDLLEGMIYHVFQHCLNVEIPLPFQRMNFEDALNTYGSDKPDLRFNLKIQDFTELGKRSYFRVFSEAEERKEVVKVIVVHGDSEFSRKQISELEEIAKTYGAKGLAWTRIKDNSFDGGIGKFYTDSFNDIISELSAENGDLLLFVADSWQTACTALGAVRKHLGHSLGLVKTSEDTEKAFSFAWIVNFPLFEYNEEESRWEAVHHMFTMPQEEYIEHLESDPASVKGELYDLVCNGIELASGSIRIHTKELQQRIFDIVGMSSAEAEKRFGFLMEAFKYGAPPHGGIAPGLDRLIMLMAGETSIREVIPFPKNTSGANPMDDSPSIVDAEQLRELGLQLIDKTPAKE